jgi:hypothetical protein
MSLRPAVVLSLGVVVLGGTLACSGGQEATTPSRGLPSDAGALLDASSIDASAGLDGGLLRSDSGNADEDVSVPLACTSTSVDHAASCANGACAIVEDVDVTCNGIFASAGIRVAPAPDVTWLATSWTGRQDTLGDQMALFRIAQGQAVYDDSVPAVLAAYAPIELALSPDGEPNVAATVTLRFGTQDAAGLGSDAFLSHGASGWAQPSFLTVPDGETMLGMDVGSDGVPHVWMSGYGPTYHHATRNPAGAWSIAPASLVGGGGFIQFTLTRDNEPAAFDFVAQTNGYPGYPWDLETLIGGTQTVLGGQLMPAATWFSVTHAISPSAGLSAPQLGAAFQVSDGVGVAWLTGSGVQVASVPGTAPPVFGCTATYNNGCPGPCHETAVGVENGSFALAWTADGIGWLAYVVTHYDKQEHFTLAPPCPPDPGCGGQTLCSTWTDTDATFYELHLARVPFDGTPASDVMTVPLAGPSASGLGDGARTLDARAFGTSLAVGILLNGFRAGGSARVLRIDTTRFAADM